jgi:predicted N-acetyltransferase YhbS
MTDLKFTIRTELPADAETVERLHERAFGPGRFARTAYRLREGAPLRLDLSFTALVGTLVVASVRQAPVIAGGVAALVLGPIAVEPAFERRGIAAALVRRALDGARDKGFKLVFLIGDEPYYGRFGFKVVPPKTVRLPGPADPTRFLYVELEPGAFAGANGKLLPADES